MEIIDTKGRLFGKINIIDFIIIVFFISFLPMFYYGYKLYKKNKETMYIVKTQFEDEKRKSEFPEIEFDCRFLGIDSEIMQLIKVGDEEKDVNRNVIAKIVSLDKDRFIENEIKKDVFARLRLRCQLKDKNIYYKDALLFPGSGQIFLFVTNFYNAKFIIISEQGQERDSMVSIGEAINKLRYRIDDMESKINTLENVLKDAKNKIDAMKECETTGKTKIR